LGDPFLAQRIALNSRFTHQNVYVVGGYMGGKTSTGAQFAHLGMSENRGANGMIAGITYTDMETTMLPEIQGIFDCYKWSTGDDVATINVHRGLIETIWGSRVFLRSFDRPHLIAGFQAAWAWIDEGELPTDPAYVMERVDQRIRQVPFPPRRVIRWRSLFVTSTMGARPRSILAHFRSRIAEGDQTYRIIRIPTTANPWVPPDYLERRKKKLSHRMYRQLILADLDALEQEGSRFGSVFHPGYHDPDHRPASGNKIRWQYRRELGYYVAVDWGLRPHALFVQHDVDGRFTGVPDSAVVFFEIYGERWSDEKFISEIGATIARLRIGVPKAFVVDPHGSTSAVGTPKLRKAFPLDRQTRRPLVISEMSPNDRREVRDALIEVLLWRMDGIRRLFFADTLDWTQRIDDLNGTFRRPVVWAVSKGYSWRRGRDGEVLLETQKDGMSDHSVEALGYLLEWLYPREAEFVGNYLGRFHQQIYHREYYERGLVN
jgi:hypothetical protein